VESGDVERPGRLLPPAGRRDHDEQKPLHPGSVLQALPAAAPSYVPDVFLHNPSGGRDPEDGFSRTSGWHGECTSPRLLPARPRVVVACPSVIECRTFAEWLVADGFEPVERPSLEAAAAEMQGRAFDLLIADAAFAFRDGLRAAGRIRDPRTPTVVIGEAAAASHRDATGPRVMYLSRPVERVMLACTVSMALLNERPARCSERKPVNRFEAAVDGMPSYILDVSNEGLRLEMPRDRRTVPPPFFNLRVPLIGSVITVRRKWARAWPDKGRTEVTLCGGAIFKNQAKAEEAWRVFVDTVLVVARPGLDSLRIR
jgi:CheY-like chemotaxis protein